MNEPSLSIEGPSRDPAYLKIPLRVGGWIYLAGLLLLYLSLFFVYMLFFMEAFGWRDRTSQNLKALFGIGGFLVFFMASLLLITGLIFYMVAFYRCWELVQDGEARTTPPAALGLLFIPIFNLFWVFVSFWGLPAELNRIAQSNRLQAPKASTLLGLLLAMYLVLAVFVLPIPVIVLLVLHLLPIYMKSMVHSGMALQMRIPKTEDEFRNIPPFSLGGWIFGLIAGSLGLLATGALLWGIIAGTGFLGDFVRAGGRLPRKMVYLHLSIGIAGAGLLIIALFCSWFSYFCNARLEKTRMNRPQSKTRAISDELSNTEPGQE